MGEQYIWLDLVAVYFAGCFLTWSIMTKSKEHK